MTLAREKIVSQAKRTAQGRQERDGAEEDMDYGGGVCETHGQSMENFQNHMLKLLTFQHSVCPLVEMNLRSAKFQCQAHHLPPEHITTSVKKQSKQNEI